MGHIVERLRDFIRARQNNRILRLSFPHGDGPQCEFVVEALEASEGLSRDFEFPVEILSSNPNIQLKDIQGKLLSIELVQQGGTLRYFSGYCFSFRLKKAENIAFYEAKLGPWLKFLSLRKDCYLFHNTNLRRQTESIFGDYGVYPVWDCKIYGDDKEMTEACQFNETDGNYLHRRWESAGIYYHYEHDDKGHKLVLADDSTRAPAIEGDPEVRFHAHVGGAQEEDAISEWSAVRFVQLQPASAAGDETVPSGRSAKHIKGTLFTHGQQGVGYEHQNSYAEPEVLASMLYSIVQIAKLARWS
ncbi:hypothetical protein CR105_01010 [Massilia eurypsychrophila]|uniref:Type VI secretion system tip protein VgrG n=1 Tax=Massilia eurypsychrophila TaxID=1485217 RepID=A0A2G8TL43_9BURK|nr:type VI secretion system Vgr family protein [Massilia eurypsychrophila]PIL46765.1 hypothetical protein CR105_01010 [Massilia eurypsychrophila]